MARRIDLSRIRERLGWTRAQHIAASESLEECEDWRRGVEVLVEMLGPELDLTKDERNALVTREVELKRMALRKARR